MGTIRARRRKDGSTGYTAQIRLHHEGRLIHAETQTFSRRQLADQWLRLREGELEGQRARGEAVGTRMTIGQMVAWYEERSREPWGRTKATDLRRLRLGRLADRRADQLSRQDFIAYIEVRRAEGAGPATAGNDLIWLRQVFKSAAAVLGVPVSLPALEEAATYLRGERLVAKSRKRNRRVSDAELAPLLARFDERRGSIPMRAIVEFALLSARRQDEITRLRWSDLDRDRGIAWLDDVKHPTRKVGNRRAFRLLSDAWAIIEAQPRQDGEPRVFPYESKSVGAAFTRMVRLLGLRDLRFHDLRHEATSRLFERGYSIQEVAQFTLHESWATLQRYTHLRPEDVPERTAPAGNP